MSKNQENFCCFSDKIRDEELEEQNKILEEEIEELRKKYNKVARLRDQMLRQIAP